MSNYLKITTLKSYKNEDGTSIKTANKIMNFRRALKDANIFLWSLGRLEEVVADITGNQIKKVDLNVVYDCVESIQKLKNHNQLVELNALIKNKSEFFDKAT